MARVIDLDFQPGNVCGSFTYFGRDILGQPAFAPVAVVQAD